MLRVEWAELIQSLEKLEQLAVSSIDWYSNLWPTQYKWVRKTVTVFSYNWQYKSMLREKFEKFPINYSQV